jgi:hypothetical protein
MIRQAVVGNNKLTDNSTGSNVSSGLCETIEARLLQACTKVKSSFIKPRLHD